MKLHEKHRSDGNTLSEALDELLVGLEGVHPEARELFVHLRDLHDGAVRLEESIAGLAALDLDDLEAIKRRLWDIRVELYEHLVPNHLEQMRPTLLQLSSEVADRLDSTAR